MTTTVAKGQILALNALFAAKQSSAHVARVGEERTAAPHSTSTTIAPGRGRIMHRRRSKSYNDIPAFRNRSATAAGDFGRPSADVPEDAAPPASPLTQALKWRKLFDPATGHYYFQHIDTLESTWVRPMGFVEPVSPTSMNGAWVKMVDQTSGREYYHNTATMVSSWTRPEGAEIGEPQAQRLTQIPEATPREGASTHSELSSMASMASELAVELLKEPGAQEEQQELQTPESKAAKKRLMVATEVLTTEKTYAQSLETLVHSFMVPLQIAAQTDEPIISQASIDKIFSTVQTVFDFNRKLLADLDARMTEWKTQTDEQRCLGDVFLTYAPFFKLYSTYCNNHESSSGELARLSSHKAWTSFHDQATAAAGMALQSYLIMPIQRIPRYKLLLQELLKNTHKGHPDYVQLDAACALVGKVATHINDDMKQQENTSKLLALQNLFSGDVQLLAAHRELVHQGILKKKSRRSTQKHYFFLFTDLLVYASSIMGVKKIKLRRRIPIADGFDVEEFGDRSKHQFMIKSQEKSFVVVADSAEDKALWLAKLRECIRKQAASLARANKPAAEHTENKPVFEQLNAGAECSCCKKPCSAGAGFRLLQGRFSHTHCHRCGKVVCFECSKTKMLLEDSQKRERVCDPCGESLREAFLERLQRIRSPLSADGGLCMSPRGARPASRSLNSTAEAQCPSKPQQARVDQLLAELHERKPMEAHDDDSMPPEDETEAGTELGADECDESLLAMVGTAGIHPWSAVPVVTAAQPESQPREAPEDDVPQLAVAQFAFVAQEANELTLKVGDVIRITDKSKAGFGWWGGTLLDGRHGQFPASYTRVLAYDPKLKYVQVTFDHKAEGATEIDLWKGDVVAVMQEDASGWWKGCNLVSDKQGWFPGRFVGACPALTQLLQQAATPPPRRPPTPTAGAAAVEPPSPVPRFRDQRRTTITTNINTFIIMPGATPPKNLDTAGDAVAAAATAATAATAAAAAAGTDAPPRALRVDVSGAAKAASAANTPGSRIANLIKNLGFEQPSPAYARTPSSARSLGHRRQRSHSHSGVHNELAAAATRMRAATTIEE